MKERANLVRKVEFHRVERAVLPRFVRPTRPRLQPVLQWLARRRPRLRQNQRPPIPNLRGNSRIHSRQKQVRTGTIRQRIQRPRLVQRLLGPSVSQPEPVGPLLGLPVELAGLADLLLQPIAEPAGPVGPLLGLPVELAGLADLLLRLIAEPAELVDLLLERLLELPHFQVAKKLAVEPAELVAELVQPVELAAELAVEPFGPVAGPVGLVVWPAELVAELVQPVELAAELAVEPVGLVAALVRRLQKILRPQIGFPERIARRRLQVLESQADFRQIVVPAALLPPEIAVHSELAGFVLPPAGLVDFGRYLGFLGPVR